MELAAWTELDFAKGLAALAVFISATLTPFILLIFSKLKDLKESSGRNAAKADAATETATAAKTESSGNAAAIGRTNDRITTVALAVTPPPSPTPESIAKAIEGTKP